MLGRFVHLILGWLIQACSVFVVLAFILLWALLNLFFNPVRHIFIFFFLDAVILSFFVVDVINFI